MFAYNRYTVYVRGLTKLDRYSVGDDTVVHGLHWSPECPNESMKDWLEVR